MVWKEKEEKQTEPGKVCHQSELSQTQRVHTSHKLVLYYLALANVVPLAPLSERETPRFY